ncbi:MAG TPA: Maebl [Clostridiales bacterium]|nr:Maebl [Clostridiales bacterium]
MDKEKRIAVLIDADNVSEKYIKYILDEVSNHGIPTYRRIYGDWTKPHLSSWKNVLLNNSISPVQQYGYTTGKNSTDSALIIDAMDILYSGHVEGFCIVSSDSDFTRLATRLREAGMYVLGMGEQKTPKPFIVACEKFKYLEVLAVSSSNGKENSENSETAEASNGETSYNKEMKKDDIKGENGMVAKKKLIKAIKDIIINTSDEDGWASLADVGNILNKRFPDFDTRNYGHVKLTPLVSSLKVFDINSRKTSNPNITHKYIKIKES